MKDLSALKAKLGKASPGAALATTPSKGVSAPGSGPVAPPPKIKKPEGKGKGTPFIKPVFVPPPEKKVEPEPEPEEKKEPEKPKPPPESLEDIYGRPDLPPLELSPMTAEEAEEMDEEIQNISKKKRLTLIPLMLVPALIFFVVGYSLGKIYYERVLYNKRIEDAKKIQDEVMKIAGQVDKVHRQLKLADPAKVDWEINEKLGVNWPLMDAGVLATSNYKGFNQVTVDRLMNFFLDSSTLFKRLRVHVRKTNNDKQALDDAAKMQGKGRDYAVIVQAVGEKQVGRLVFLKGEVKEGDNLTGYKIQVKEGGPIIDMSAQRTVVMDKKSMVAIAQPNEAKHYSQRLSELLSLSTKLKKIQVELISGLEEISKLEKVFVF